MMQSKGTSWNEWPSPKHREDKPEGLEFPPLGRLFMETNNMRHLRCVIVSRESTDEQNLNEEPFLLNSKERVLIVSASIAISMGIACPSAF